MNYTLDNGILHVEVAALGAELQSIKTADGHEYLWQGDEKYWADRAPNLFPTVGRLLNGRYTHLGKPYELGLHGFVRHAALQAQQQESELCFTLCDNEETRKQFPFAFCYQVIYRLEGNRICVCYRVENRGEQPMYFGLGGHPGFFVPMCEDAVFEDYRVRFSNPGETLRVEFSDRGLFVREYPFALEENSISLKHELFDNDAIVLRNSGDLVCLEHRSGEGRRVCVSYPDMPYVGFWQATKTDAPYLCIEPWQSLPGREGVTEELSERPGMIALAPAEVYENSWFIDIF